MQETNSEGIGLKLGLAIFSFVLGLIATYVANTFWVDEKKIAYSINSEPLIAVDSAVNIDPHLSQTFSNLNNVTAFKIRIENIGDLPVVKFSALLETDKGSKII